MTEQEYSPELQRPASATELFIAFTLLALQGFGGVLAVAQRVLVDQRRWLRREDFLELLSVGQVLPGPNVCNLALMIGDRFYGLRGAFAALAGMMAVPLVIVIALTALYVHWSGHPMVAGALRGMAAVSAGLIIGSALKLMPALRKNPMGLQVCVALGALTFAGIALLRWPLIWVLLVLGLAGWAYAYRCIRADLAAKHGGVA